MEKIGARFLFVVSSRIHLMKLMKSLEKFSQDNPPADPKLTTLSIGLHGIDIYTNVIFNEIIFYCYRFNRIKQVRVL